MSISYPTHISVTIEALDITNGLQFLGLHTRSQDSLRIQILTIDDLLHGASAKDIVDIAGEQLYHCCHQNGEQRTWQAHPQQSAHPY